MPGLSASRRALGLALLLLVLGEGAYTWAGLARAPLTLDIGPSTGAYLTGFADSEERPPVTSRWARNRARIEWPLAATPGAALLRVRAARFLDQPVRVQVFGSGVPLGAFDVPPGRFREHEVPVVLPAGSLSLEFASDGPNDLAFALDWLRVEGVAWRVPWTQTAPRLLMLGTLALALWAGLGFTGASVSALIVIAVQALGLALDPFASLHVQARLAAPALLAAFAVAALLRARPAGRVIVMLFLASVLVKGATVLHPSYFYNDVRNNRRFVEALRDDPGSFYERRHTAQVRIGVAYPRVVAGQKYAFPYSPVFFMPFGLAGRDPAAVEEAMKIAVALAAGAECVIVFLLAGLLLGPGRGVVAALVAALLPVFTSRLVLALWSTLGGHMFDSLALLAAVAWALRPAAPRRYAATAAAVLASYLTYVASLFNMALFTGWLGLLVTRLRGRAWAAGAGAAVLTVGVLYPHFTVQFATEILPAYLRVGAQLGGGAKGSLAPSAAQVDTPASEAEGADGDGVPASRRALLTQALARVPLFYGWLLVPLALVQLLRWRSRVDALAYRVLLAYGASFLVLVALRGLAGGLFKDMKEIEFVAPWVALLAGTALEDLWRAGGWRRAASLLLTGAIALWATTFSCALFRTWTRLAGLGA